MRTRRTERDADTVANWIEEVRVLMGIADRQIPESGWQAGADMALAGITFGTALFGI